MTTDHQQYTEDALVEQPTIALFKALGYTTANCYTESFGVNSTLGRETTTEVVLVPRLKAALIKLNGQLTVEAINLAIEEIIRDRSSMSMVNANREIYKLLKDGVNVTLRDENGEEVSETVQVIDWNEPKNNDFFLASQFWISGEMYKRRADLIGFVNGLPLIFIELKAAHRRLENAYNDNLRDYKNTVPQLFWYNAVVILSNGSQSKAGTITATWEYFSEWKKINSEGETGVVSLETMIRSICEKTRLLDIVENFTLFSDAEGKLIKIIAKNHQYLGVNNSIEAVKQMGKNRGKLGVFWHTQGSGKSYSMIFFSQKILRKLPGNWTFLIITDREALDEQIYKNFESAGAVTEKHVQATSGKHLQKLLKEDHRNIFTLIQKFGTKKGEAYPKLSDRSDIIVITDEAHRSQYDNLAGNMRNALPNASFIAFTGTPLMAGEEKTKDVFGDYVSIYNFSQSVEDKATVPLYYENRIPELQLADDDLEEGLDELLDYTDEEQDKRLQKEFVREYHLITREDRLEKIAEDIVSHYMGRGFMGKAMVISIDRFTTVKMYDKVKKHWGLYIDKLKDQLQTCPHQDRENIQKKITYMELTDMAVIISQSQNEVETFQKKKLDIIPHRKRIIDKNDDLGTKFKNSDDPLRIVFVCSMWLTGFDVQSLSTLYLDKPMKNHNLMQTIARANRVFKGKHNGLIVDYIGVFRNMQKALAIYGNPTGGGNPVEGKGKLVEELRVKLEETNCLCKMLGINLEKIIDAQGYDKIKLVDDAVEFILGKDVLKRKFLSLVSKVAKLFKAILPDRDAHEFITRVRLYVFIAEKIGIQIGPGPVTDQDDEEMDQLKEVVQDLLDESITADTYVINKSETLDLSNIDFEKLKEHFKKARKNTEVERLKSAINAKLREIVPYNKTRVNYVDKFKKMIDEYNAGSKNLEKLFADLIKFAQDLNQEDKRAMTEQLTEEELAVFDILIRPELKLSEKEKKQIKKVARDLLEKLKKEKLVLDWKKRQQSRAQVRVTIEEILDQGLPKVFTSEIYEDVCGAVYGHVYDSYYGQGQSIYVHQ
ncbi:type I restriction endonuclease subunit R [Desulfosporosinus sp. SYSU MS00001]|uniref:type I restriction endonuclease subunit R n=1 Tax=Desulfosporosinus sp. SYSU MS00001 TaxID=3416284 RepID=UPI003CE9A3CA